MICSVVQIYYSNWVYGLFMMNVIDYFWWGIFRYGVLSYSFSRRLWQFRGFFFGYKKTL